MEPEALQALKEALAKRAGGDPMAALSQQSAASPTAAVPPAGPSGGLPSAGAPKTPPLTGPERSAENTEARLIVGALKERLKAISTVEGGIPPKAPGGGTSGGL